MLRSSRRSRAKWQALLASGALRRWQRGFSGARHRSDAEQIVRAAPVPVLLVRPKEEAVAAAGRVVA